MNRTMVSQLVKHERIETTVAKVSCYAIRFCVYGVLDNDYQSNYICRIDLENAGQRGPAVG